VTVTIGLASIGLGAAMCLVGAFVLWPRLPVWAAASILAVAGVLLGAGALLVQDHPGPGDWLIALPALAACTPLHLRVLMGPPGTRGALGQS
jgi:hypothetical protein